MTSPTGQLDAVLVREDGGGAPGGWEWYVYIVAKGHPVDPRFSEVFHAGTLTGEKLVWVGENMLEIHYDIANIEQFRNLWRLDEIQDVGSRGERDYFVEIQLAPAKGRSIVAPDGGLRHRGYESQSTTR